VPRCPMNWFCETFNIISGLKHQKPNNLDFFYIDNEPYDFVELI